MNTLLDECDVTFFQSSGPGGQHKNRTRTAVRLRHRPTGIVAIGKRERSQRQNLKAALKRLIEKLSAALAVKPPRKATRPSPAARERRISQKKRRAGTKRSRGRISPEE